MSTVQLERETTPPEGQLSCPKPQYTNSTTGEYEALKGKDGGAMMVSAVYEKTHHLDAVAQADGSDADVRGFKTIALQISGTSASRTVQFKASVDGTNFVDIAGVNAATFSVATSTTGTGEIWQFDTSGFKYFRARLEAVSGGNVTVVSNAVI